MGIERPEQERHSIRAPEPDLSQDEQDRRNAGGPGGEQPGKSVLPNEQSEQKQNDNDDREGVASKTADQGQR